MPLLTRRRLAAFTAMALFTTASQANEDLTQAPDNITAVDMINLFEQLNGPQPGFRKGHAKGVCAAGMFTPTEQANARFDSPLFDQPSAFIARFSMGGGNPHADESSRSARGVALQFQLPEGARHQIAGLTTPVFAGKTPEQFFGLLRVMHAMRTGKADDSTLKGYFANNPEAAAAAGWLQQHAPGAEYTSTRYFGVHTFYANDEAGDRVKFRWTLEPQDGETLLTEEQMNALPDTFLAERLAKRLGDSAVTYDWYWVIGEEQDPDIDPSKAWPDDRLRIKVGTVTFDNADTEACEPVNFDPNVVASGIMPSDDPVLRMRSAAYAISFGKRLSGQ
ncbi:catalase family peroxidase [Aestuariibacter halophilus]|uniref:Catalase-related peroxidase n=1 Tax=Fluctibacter halophilus TaxID=226011 RepID=A0ABS8G7G9_9ALTE|nr:catalase family peroxidase [Aestuariibacter halophilus]MCC2616544.1 catalase family peroxidase [Aestuariibacter halophilus]